MKNFLIYTNVHKDQGLAITNRIQQYLLQKGCQVTVVAQEEAAGNVPEDIDCMLVLGGDGTILRAVREVKELHIPIVGVNLGTLGYMTQIEPDQVEQAMDQILAGDVEPEERMMLWSVAKTKGGACKEQWALNDVVISRKGSLQINDFNISVNGQFLKKYSADGIIITTPTGSTGYNLSAGGPIAAPATKLIMVTPICPHTLNQRSIILSPTDKIVVDIPLGRDGNDQEVEVSFDGSGQIRLTTGDSITITRSEKEIVFLKLNKMNFLEILRRKMSEN